MNFETLYATAGGRAIRAALVGVGQFGVALVTQAARMSRLTVPVLCDCDLERAQAACQAAGIEPAQRRVCADPGSARAALAAGHTVLVGDPRLAATLPVDIVVEATGNPEAAALTAEAAIDAGHHVAMVTKECESVVGPLLAERAREAGVVYTPVDGDQPSLLIGLISWARTLGLSIVCAGKSSEYDFVYERARGTVNCNGREVPAPGLDALWTLDRDDAPATVAARARVLAALAQRTVPDLCEMSVVCNATGLAPDTPMFHVPVARALEVPELLRPGAEGGLLAGEGVIDVFNCLRRPDEQSFAGGVFVVVRCHDRETWEGLAHKGHPVSADRATAMLYNPQHLLGLEAPISLLNACVLGQSSGAVQPRPHFDLVARAARPWRAGERLAITDSHHHEVAGLDPMLVPGAAAGPGRPLPYYMAAGAELRVDVPAGAFIERDMVDAPADSALWRLRALQDAHFFPAG